MAKEPVDLNRLPTVLALGPFWSIAFVVGAFIGLMTTRNPMAVKVEIAFIIIGLVAFVLISVARSRAVTKLKEET